MQPFHVQLCAIKCRLRLWMVAYVIIFSNVDGFWSFFQLVASMTYFIFPIGWFFIMSSCSFHNIVYTFNCTCNQSNHIIVACKVHMLPNNYMYKLFNNLYIPICIYLPIKYLPTYLPITYIPIMYIHLTTYLYYVHIPTYLITKPNRLFNYKWLFKVS